MMRRFSTPAMAVIAAALAIGAPDGVHAASVPAAGIGKILSDAGFDVPAKSLESTDFSLESLGGGTLALSSLKGKIVFLNFWATWCGPCNIELPSMKAMYEKLKAKGLEIVAVDLMEDKKTVSDFVKAKKLPFTVLLDTDGRVGGLYGTEGIPTTFLIDRTGKILARKVGIDGPAWDSPERLALLEKLLAL